MPGHPNGRPRIRQLVAALLLLILILAEIAGNPAYSSGTSTSSIAASPGKFDLPLGNDFPTFGSVKLSYPDSAILTNSTGDLLFSVALNPLMLNPSSGQVLAQVLVQGFGFSPSDSSCSLLGNPVASPSCTISGGSLTGSFVVGNVPAGSYTVTATGNQEGDYSSASFTVLPPVLVLNPSSGPDGATVSFSGVGFYSTDSSCVLTGSPAATLPSCSIAGGVLTPGSFVVASTAPIGAYTITATTNGGRRRYGRSYDVLRGHNHFSFSTDHIQPLDRPAWNDHYSDKKPRIFP